MWRYVRGVICPLGKLSVGWFVHLGEVSLGRIVHGAICHSASFDWKICLELRTFLWTKISSFFREIWYQMSNFQIQINQPIGRHNFVRFSLEKESVAQNWASFGDNPKWFFTPKKPILYWKEREGSKHLQWAQQEYGETQPPSFLRLTESWIQITIWN